MRLPKNDQDFFNNSFDKTFRRMFIANLILFPLYLGAMAAFICGVVYGVVKVLQMTGVM